MPGVQSITIKDVHNNDNQDININDNNNNNECNNIKNIENKVVY